MGREWAPVWRGAAGAGASGRDRCAATGPTRRVPLQIGNIDLGLVGYQKLCNGQVAIRAGKIQRGVVLVVHDMDGVLARGVLKVRLGAQKVAIAGLLVERGEPTAVLRRGHASPVLLEKGDQAAPAGDWRQQRRQQSRGGQRSQAGQGSLPAPGPILVCTPTVLLSPVPPAWSSRLAQPLLRRTLHRASRSFSLTLTCSSMAKLHGSLARAGKVRKQTEKVAKQKRKYRPKGRAWRRQQFKKWQIRQALPERERRKGPNSNAE